MKKLIAIFLLGFMLCSMLTSCGLADIFLGDNDDNSLTDGNGGDKGNKPEDKLDPPTYTVGTDIGDLMQNVELTKINSEGTVSIEEYRGKIVVFNLWATWCPPCIRELPHFDQFANDYGNDVVIIAAHVADNNGNASSYVASNFPESKIIFAYDTSNNIGYTAAGGNGYVPYTVILDRNGVIVYSDSGALSYIELEQIIEPYK